MEEIVNWTESGRLLMIIAVQCLILREFRLRMSFWQSSSNKAPNSIHQFLSHSKFFIGKSRSEVRSSK
ncbi:hypothetical protein BDZ94DRAFT_900471 [Collybia nuda]|uniref:Uncharacterized protein n=1 Tax=Collybia nuda TaxID=64659 RepID=A0A9P6CIL0_9AGAR|nr:hypothetical protein BDZ94DRAFT_900471 [Collybia nuda]